MRELDIKSPSKNKGKLTMVRLAYDFIAFGINSSQLSATMDGISLSWDEDHVSVRHSSFPGQEKWVLPGGIKELTWKTE